jgi:hypothetical protein
MDIAQIRRTNDRGGCIRSKALASERNRYHRFHPSQHHFLREDSCLLHVSDSRDLQRISRGNHTSGDWQIYHVTARRGVLSHGLILDAHQWQVTAFCGVRRSQDCQIGSQVMTAHNPLTQWVTDPCRRHEGDPRLGIRANQTDFGGGPVPPRATPNSHSSLQSSPH